MLWRVERGDPYAILPSLMAEAGEAGPLPAIRRDGRGKPFFPARPDLPFSVSHSGEWGMAALSHRPVGCDVELVRPRRAGLPAYALDGRELEWFRARGGRWEDFYALWTLKEARVKCTGEGLSRPARAISVPLLAPGEGAEVEGFRFLSLGGEGWRGAVCEDL